MKPRVPDAKTPPKHEISPPSTIRPSSVHPGRRALRSRPSLASCYKWVGEGEGRERGGRRRGRGRGRGRRRGRGRGGFGTLRQQQDARRLGLPSRHTPRVEPATLSRASSWPPRPRSSTQAPPQLCPPLLHRMMKAPSSHLLLLLQPLPAGARPRAAGVLRGSAPVRRPLPACASSSPCSLRLPCRTLPGILPHPTSLPGRSMAMSPFPWPRLAPRLRPVRSRHFPAHSSSSCSCLAAAKDRGCRKILGAHHLQFGFPHLDDEFGCGISISGSHGGEEGCCGGHGRRGAAPRLCLPPDGPRR